MSSLYDKSTPPTSPQKHENKGLSANLSFIVSLCLAVAASFVAIYLERNNADLTKKVAELANRQTLLETAVRELETTRETVGRLKEIEQRLVKVEAAFTKTNDAIGRFDNTQTELQMLKDIVETLKMSVLENQEHFNEKISDLTTNIERQEKCQSGLGVGAHTHPQHSFPYTVTVKFDPPFKNVPSFVYGTTMLDASKVTHYNTILRELTAESFTLHIHTWTDYYLWGARVSWMACPK